MQRYEFKIVSGPPDGKMETQLNQLSSEGWEVFYVGVSPKLGMFLGSGDTSEVLTIVLRRAAPGSA